MYVVISITLAIVVIVIYFMKKSKKDKRLREFEEFFIKGLTEMKSNQTNEYKITFTETMENKLTKIHQDFRVTLAPMEEMSDGINPDVDISTIKFKWVSCPDDSTLQSCIMSR